MTKLNIGCGKKKMDGYINIDLNPRINPDILMDASNIDNYKRFRDGSISEIISEHFLEHTLNPEAIMKEWHRMLVPGGIIKLKFPHFSRGFTTPTHHVGFDICWSMHFDKDNATASYTNYNLTLIKRVFRWIVYLDLYPCGKITKFFLLIMDRIISLLANLNPEFCSRIWCYWVGGFEEIEMWFKKDEKARIDLYQHIDHNSSRSMVPASHIEPLSLW